MSAIPGHESMLLGARLKGHAEQNRDDAADCHGNHGYGVCNERGEEIFLANAYFTKKDEHLATFASGYTRLQVDYWAVRGEHKNVVDCKIIHGESCLTQRTTLLLKLRAPREHRQRRSVVVKEKIK